MKILTRTRGKHDPDEIIRRLQEENDGLRRREAPANDFFALLYNDVVTTNAAWETEKTHRQHAEKTLTEAWEYIARLEVENDSLTAELAPHRAAEANANKVTVPPMERDTAALEDQATEPHGIDVRTLREADAAGLLSPVVRISDSGATADPATVRIPTVREPAA